MQASRDLYLSFGEKHARNHFPSARQFSEGLQHQLEILSSRVGSSSIGGSNAIADVRHPFMSCTDYLQYNATVASLSAQIGETFQSHITYSSGIDDRICFVVFVTDTTALRTYISSLESKELTLFVPVPDVLKMDHSVLHAIDWTIDRSSNALKNVPGYIRDKNVPTVTGHLKHPILNDLAKGLPVEISVIFRPSWSSLSQKLSADSWFKSLLESNANGNANDHRTLKERTAHWDDFIWTKQNSYSTKVGGNTGENSPRNTRYSRRLQLQGSEEYSSIFERINTLPPYFDNSEKTIEIETNAKKTDREQSSKIRAKWSALRAAFLNLHLSSGSGSGSGTLSSSRSSVESGPRIDIDAVTAVDLEEVAESNRNSNSQSSSHINSQGHSNSTDKCDYRSIRVDHRKNNVLLKFGPMFFQSTEHSAACLANIMVLLAADSGVSRIALSRPLRLLNR